jgi:hypothetical protein
MLDCHPAFLSPSGRPLAACMPSRRVGKRRTFNGIVRYTVGPMGVHIQIFLCSFATRGSFQASSYFFTADTDPVLCV